MFRCYSYTIISDRINLCLLKLRLLTQSTADTAKPTDTNKDLIYAATLPPY